MFLSALVAPAGTDACNHDYREISNLARMNRGVYGIRSMADGAHYTVIENNNIVRYLYAEKTEGERLLPPTVKNLPITDYTFSPDEKSILIASGATQIYRHSYTTDYRLFAGGKLRKALPEAKDPRDASFSPDGRLIIYSDHNDLYVTEVATGMTRRVTDDGEWNKIINGTTDWVYEEEFGFTKAYAVSPDSRKLAYLRFDESEVPMMEFMRFDNQLYNKAFSYKYPKAGDANSIVELWVYDLTTGKKERIDTGTETDQYIARLGFTPDNRLWYHRLNRRQNLFDMMLCEPNGAQRVIYHEGGEQYVERIEDQTVTFIDNDRFIVRQEEKTGYMHLYLYSAKNGSCLRQITRGEWEVTQVVGHDDKRVWYLSTETSPLRRNLYSIRFDGKDKCRLTQGEGFYSIAPSKGMKYYISTFSNATTPNRVEICDGKGKVVRLLQENKPLQEELARTNRPHKEFFTFTTERGDQLNAWMLKPADFDPSKKYPVLLTQYSGPGSQQVQDRWSVDWEDALVRHGYIVVCTDGRGTGFRGEAFKKQTYGRLGFLETEDQISFAKYMQRQSYVDADRIGIYGWSFGGFMALSCSFKGMGLFRMAIAVAPVTSWRYYDTIYTEIYNDLPQYNAAGYDDNSPVQFANLFDDEKTSLLIIHGTADDNVHLQNTMEVTRALNRYNKQYDMMIYPDQNHSMMPDDRHNIRQKMIDYTLEHL